MFSHFALTEVWPTITHANRQADTGSRPRASKVVIICLVVLWNGQLLAATDEDNMSKEYSDCMDKSGGVTVSMMECNGDEIDRQDAQLERIPVMFEHSRHGERSSCILAG
jgi:hypothetical protein